MSIPWIPWSGEGGGIVSIVQRERYVREIGKRGQKRGGGRRRRRRWADRGMREMWQTREVGMQGWEEV